MPLARGRLLELPPFKLDGTAYDWQGRLPLVSRAHEYPILWTPQGIHDFFGGSSDPFFTGIRGVIEPGRIIRPPKLLFRLSFTSFQDLVADYEDSLNEQGVIFCLFFPVNSDADGLNNFLPFHTFDVYPDPQSYVGGEMYCIGYLDSPLHYTVSQTTYNTPVSYNTYTFNIFTNVYEISGTASHTQSVTYNTAATATARLATDIAGVAAALARFERTRYIVHYEDLRGNVTAATSSVDFVYGAGPAEEAAYQAQLANPPPSSQPKGNGSAADGLGNFLGGFIVYVLSSVIATTGPYYDDLAALAGQFAAAMPDGEAFEFGFGDGDDDILIPEIVEFFGLEPSAP